MPNKTQPGPTTPFYKEKGKWSFYVFPRGVPEEAGEYRDEETARAVSCGLFHEWGERVGRSAGRHHEGVQRESREDGPQGLIDPLTDPQASKLLHHWGG